MNVYVCPQAWKLGEPRPTTCTQKQLSSNMDAITVYAIIFAYSYFRGFGQVR